MNKTMETSVAVDVAGKWHNASAPGTSEGALYLTTAETDGPFRTLKIKRADGSAFSAEKIKVSVKVPLLNYAHVVIPDCGRHYVAASKALDIRAPVFRVSAPNAGHPFMALADESGGFLCAFGVVSPTGEVAISRKLPRISNRKAMVGGDQHLCLDFVWSNRGGEASELEVALYLGEKCRTWFHALREYAHRIKERESIEQAKAAGAWDPVWCTWTAFCSKDMTGNRVLENTRIAYELGIRNVILDDGWFGIGLDDDTAPPTLGDYYPAPNKYPDFRRHVKQLQELGMRVLLWHAPLCVSEGTKAYEKMRRFLVLNKDGSEFRSTNGLAILCPACPEVRQYVVDETVRLMRETGVDGFKVDLFNCLPAEKCCSTEHGHDFVDGIEALDAVMSAQWAAMRSVRPDALCELKQDYGNVRLSRHGTMTRAGDTAYDIDTNCRRCFYTAAVTDCVHNDYFITSHLATAQSIRYAMIRMLTAGVPTFGNDLVATPLEHRRIVKEWLTFYAEHRAMFMAPREPQTNDLSVWQGGDSATAWVSGIWNCCEIDLPDAKRIFVLNGTPRRSFHVRLPESRRMTADVSVCDGDAQSGSHRVVLANGSQLAVPPGGWAEILVEAEEPAYTEVKRTAASGVPRLRGAVAHYVTE